MRLHIRMEAKSAAASVIAVGARLALALLQQLQLGFRARHRVVPHLPRQRHAHLAQPAHQIVHDVLVIVADERVRNAFRAAAAGAADTVGVPLERLLAFGQLVVDHGADARDVDTAGHDVGGNQAAHFARLEGGQAALAHILHASCKKKKKTQKARYKKEDKRGLKQNEGITHGIHVHLGFAYKYTILS